MASFCVHAQARLVKPRHAAASVENGDESKQNLDPDSANMGQKKTPLCQTSVIYKARLRKNSQGTRKGIKLFIIRWTMSLATTQNISLCEPK